jgi:hypothetical protein
MVDISSTPKLKFDLLFTSDIFKIGLIFTLPLKCKMILLMWTQLKAYVFSLLSSGI